MKKDLKILLLEDSADDAFLIEVQLTRAGVAFNLVTVTRKDEFASALMEFGPDVILSDHSLPQFNSIEALKICRAHESQTGIAIPFILVTGNVSEEFAVQALKAGVDDYILKDRLKRLPLSIESAIEKCQISNERTKYLQQVMVKEALMSEAEQLANFCSWQADLITGKLTWSDAAYRLYGYTHKEIEPSYELFFSMVHPDDIKALKESQEYALKNLDSDGYEFRIIDQAGQLKYISCRIRVHRDADGAPIRLVGFNLDVTERKMGQLALEKSEQQYKALFDQYPDPVFSLDTEGRFINVNKAMIRLTGLSAAGLAGRDFREVLHRDDQEKMYGYFRSALEGVQENFEVRVLNTNGQTVVMNLAYIPIVVNGEIVGVHGMGRA